ncbi:MAG: hypothetical protein ACOX0X_03270 [Candidatus Dojkabacteria bacterium]|jgi:hypothetical protein
MEKETENLLGLIVFSILLVISAVITGFVLSVLWRWFIIPIFSLPPLSIPQATGIAIIVDFLTYQRHEEKDDNKKLIEKFLGSLVYVIFYPLIILGLGWVIQLFL